MGHLFVAGEPSTGVKTSMNLLSYQGEQDLALLPELAAAIRSHDHEKAADALIVWIGKLNPEFWGRGGETQALRVILDSARAMTPHGKTLFHRVPEHVEIAVKALKVGDRYMGAPAETSLRRSLIEFFTAAIYF